MAMKKIFISYSHKDEYWKDLLLRHLKVLALEGLCDSWDDRRIQTGEEWKPAIEKALDEAHIAILMVSADFLVSNFIRTEEVPRLLERRKSQGVWVIPLFVSPCPCKKVPWLAAIQGVPRDNETLEELKDRGQKGRVEKILADLAEEIAGKIQIGTPEVLPGSIFDPPIVNDAITRPSLLAGLKTALREHSVVVLGGLSGSGKTYLMSSYIADRLNVQTYSRVLWYDPSEGESLDNLLVFLGYSISLRGRATASRCKALLALLREQNSLLVVDNYHIVDQSTYALLVEVFSHAGSPCRLVLLSQKYVALPTASRDPYQLIVSGFSLNEIYHFMEDRGLQGLPSEVLAELIEKTDGLPFAINQFALLVGVFGHDPIELLSGTMENETRIRTWFDRVLSIIDLEARRLLPYLSLDWSPFNIGVVRLLSRHIGLINSDFAFEQLQRCYLVGKHSPYRWKVHDLVANLSRSSLKPIERECAHSWLGHYFMRGIPKRRNVLLTEEQFMWKVRAFRHLWRSSAEKSLAISVLNELSSTVKARGYYSLFLELSAEIVSSQSNQDRWIDYHHAHCALIIGHPEYCLRIIEPFLNERDVIGSETQRLSFTRLYSEALCSMNQERKALPTLIQAINTSAVQKVGAVALAQAKSVLVWLLTRVGEYDEALRKCHELLGEAQRMNDERGGAVAWARMGVVKLRSGLPQDALDNLTRAVDLFRRVGDRRGEAWSLTNCAEAYLIMGEETHAKETFCEASGIKSDIGECSVDYRESLSRMRTMTTQEQLNLLITKEIERIELSAAFTLRRLTKVATEKML